MQRICTSLSNAGFNVMLIGRELRSSASLQQKPYAQKRLRCFFNKRFLFYGEYNLRLFFFLLTKKMDAICAIDLDTILPCYFVSVLRRKKRIYDAHELFCEMKEVVSRPHVYKIWKKIEKFSVPRFANGYTVNSFIRDILKEEYKVNYEVIRNVPVLEKKIAPTKPENFVLYQGAVNEGRSFETLIPAFQWINVPFVIYGDGNFMAQAKTLIKEHKLEEKVFLKGKADPAELKKLTPRALLGITIFENKGQSNYYSLANRFFDYMQAGVPQLCVDYPAYKEINDEYKVAVLTGDLSSKSLAEKINAIVRNENLLNELRQNCERASEKFNWQAEEKILFQFYQRLFA
jgi:glycosyltransferase involved in cell wall biosynthesis